MCEGLIVSGWQPPALGATINLSKEQSQLEQPHADAPARSGGAEPCPGDGAGTHRLEGDSSAWGGVTHCAGPEGAESREPAAVLLPAHAGICAVAGMVPGPVAALGRGATWAARAAPQPWLCVPRELGSVPGLRPRQGVRSSSKASSSAGIPWRVGWGPSIPRAHRAVGPAAPHGRLANAAVGGAGTLPPPPPLPPRGDYDRSQGAELGCGGPILPGPVLP